MVVGDIETGAELVVIGAGPGGYTAAIKASRRGKEVVLVDKEDIGGVCLNRGCIPAKALIHSSVLKEAAEDWPGFDVDSIEVDMENLQEWKSSTVEKLTGGVEKLLESNGVEVMKGTARFVDSNTIRVEEEHDAENIDFEKAIVATGSVPVELPGFEFDQDRVLSSRELLNLEEVPEELVIIGGGYIGLEAATEFSNFGSTVKVIEARDRILADFDSEITQELENSEEFIDELHVNTEARELKEKEGKTVVAAEKDGEETEIEGDKVLVAAGRKTRDVEEELSLQETDVEVEDGFIQVDSQMQTDDPDIFAIGDVIGQPMLAHKAYREAKVAADVVSGRHAAFDNQYIPKVIYTEPEIAVVGANPEEAREEHGDVKIGRFPFTASGRAMTTDSTDGFVRVVADEDGKLLGTQIIGPRASDMIAEATLALEMQAYLDDVANTIHAHPTFPEAFMEACEDAKGESVHTA